MYLSCKLFQLATASVLISLLMVTCPSEGLKTKTTSSCYNQTTQIRVNETVEEWCAALSATYCWALGTCYCNVTKEVVKSHVTEICDDGDNSGGSGSGGRTLTDPEVAAIAVISSLVFSILLSLTVFFIQRRNRVGCSCCTKTQQSHLVQVERGQRAVEADAPDSGETDKFLSSDGDKDRVMHVKAANRETNLYEDVEPARARQISMSPLGHSSKTTPPNRTNTPSTAMVGNDSHGPNTPTKRYSSSSSTQTESISTQPKPMETAATNTTNSLENQPGRKRDDTRVSTPELNQAETSSSSLKLNISEDDLYENIQTSVL